MEIEEAKFDLLSHIGWSKGTNILIVGGEFNAHIRRGEE